MVLLGAPSGRGALVESRLAVGLPWLHVPPELLKPSRGLGETGRAVSRFINQMQPFPSAGAGAGIEHLERAPRPLEPCPACATFHVGKTPAHLVRNGVNLRIAVSVHRKGVLIFPALREGEDQLHQELEVHEAHVFVAE